MAKVKKILMAIALLGIIFSYSAPVFAQNGIIKDNKQVEMDKNTNSFADQSGIDKTKSLEDMIATTIRMVLATLGTIFIVLMFIAGNDWMQAAGNEEKVNKSKAKIRSLIIGLVIVLVSYALSSGFSSLLAGAMLK